MQRGSESHTTSHGAVLGNVRAALLTPHIEQSAGRLATLTALIVMRMRGDPRG